MSRRGLVTLPTQTPASWRLLDDVQVEELPDPSWLIDKVVPRHGVGVVYGPSASGKTTLVANLLSTLATGGTWFGYEVTRRGPSVYVATEDPSGFKIRLRATKLAAGLALDDLASRLRVLRARHGNFHKSRAARSGGRDSSVHGCVSVHSVVGLSGRRLRFIQLQRNQHQAADNDTLNPSASKRFVSRFAARAVSCRSK